MWVQFGNSDGDFVGLHVGFSKRLPYNVGKCGQGEIQAEKLGTDRNRIWTIEKVESRVMLSCNGVEIVDIKTRDSENKACRSRWAVDFARMKFVDNSETDKPKAKDTASDYFRQYITGKQEALCWAEQ